jgi:hypothetical protein
MAKQKLKYETVLNDFLKAREWTDSLNVDVENKSVSLSSGIRFGQISGKLIIEAYDTTDLVDVYIYFDVTCKDTKLDQMALLMNGIHQRWAFGRFVVLADGYMRWQHRVDFEGSEPTGLSIERIVGPGWDTAERFGEFISSVALTKQTAADALEEYAAIVEAERTAQEEDDEGPSEL